eukprot:Em0015g813a
MSFDPDATRLETQLYRRSLSVASKLRKTRGAKRIDVLFGSTITTIYKGELFPAAVLVEERSVANDLLAEADAMIYDLQNQLIFVRQELTEAHETLASQYCNKGGTTDIDKSDSSEANLRVFYPLDRFGQTCNPYPIELFLSSDMKFTLLRLGLNGANSIYACPFCTMHRDNRWDVSKAEAHYTNTVVRTLAILLDAALLPMAKWQRSIKAQYIGHSLLYHFIM